MTDLALKAREKALTLERKRLREICMLEIFRD